MSDDDVDISSRGDDLSLRFKTFTLTHAESKEVTILEEDIKLSEAECRRSLIGKVVTSKTVNLHGIKNTMAPLWGYPTGFKVLEIGENLFQFGFGLEEDLLRVLAGKPWFFSNSFLILTRWKPEMKVHQMVFNHSPIWIQVWGLPLQFYSVAVGTKIGKSVGEFLEIDMPASGHREGRLMRIMVSIDITVPLRRGMKLKLDEGEPFWVELRYEKLPMFCCYCGFLGHDQKSCVKQSKDLENGTFKVETQYGNWLRASPGKSSGWKKYGPGGNRWSATSPAKSGNSKPYDHGAVRGGEIIQNPKLAIRSGKGYLSVTDLQEQIGDTAENGILLENSSQRNILSIPSSVTAGILKPKSLGPILSQGDFEPISNSPLRVNQPNNTAHKPTLLGPVTSLQAPKPSPKKPSPTQKSPINLSQKIPPPQTILNLDHSTLPSGNTQLSNPSPTANPNLHIESSVSPGIIFTSGVTTLDPNFQKKDAIPSQRKRGRPIGSKSRSDRRRITAVQDGGSASSADFTPPTVSVPRVGEKRPSSVVESKGTARTGDAVSSPAKRSRVEGKTTTDEDSIMDDSISSGTVEEASREWPHGVQ
ncbi:hypothetical protein Vadar_014294 [Vaccinium darrowii]|uniref:Uncharacterized protein n=1 Tax=Vaccinium darrowii TaxID=229202 RepID=A0ACB7YDS8_9ERIC|nr:hypothetical protein Vadar_014294 [Vaccinium darrowii]